MYTVIFDFDLPSNRSKLHGIEMKEVIESLTLSPIDLTGSRSKQSEVIPSVQTEEFICDKSAPPESSSSIRTEDLITLQDENVMTTLSGLKIVETSRESIHELNTDEVAESEVPSVEVLNTPPVLPFQSSNVEPNTNVVAVEEEELLCEESSSNVEGENSTFLSSYLGK